jgi:hypothetical protein
MHKENSMRRGNSLQDKRVIVLGGSSGIGLEVAKQAASQGGRRHRFQACGTSSEGR